MQVSRRALLTIGGLLAPLVAKAQDLAKPAEPAEDQHPELHTADVTLSGSLYFECECGAILYRVIQADGTKTICCTAPGCKNERIVFEVPTLTVTEYETEDKKAARRKYWETHGGFGGTANFTWDEKTGKFEPNTQIQYND